MRIRTNVGEHATQHTGESPRSHATPSNSSGDVSPSPGSPRPDRRSQLLEQAKMTAKTGISVKYPGNSLSPKREYDNRGLSTFSGPHHAQHHRPFHYQYRRTAQESFEYTQKSSPRHFMGFPMNDRNPFKQYEGNRDAPAPGDYQRTAEKSSKPPRKKADVTKLPPLRNFDPQPPGPANYNAAAAYDTIRENSPRTVMHNESFQDVQWGERLSPRMRWVLPMGGSLRNDFRDKSHLGPGTYSPR